MAVSLSFDQMSSHHGGQQQKLIVVSDGTPVWELVPEVIVIVGDDHLCIGKRVGTVFLRPSHCLHAEFDALGDRQIQFTISYSLLTSPLG